MRPRVLTVAALLVVAAGCSHGPVLTPDIVSPYTGGWADRKYPIAVYVYPPAELEARWIRQAEVIVLGTVVDRVGEEHERSTRTVITMSVERCIKGSCGLKIRFYVLGGKVGGRSSEVHPGITYPVGERAVVLLGMDSLSQRAGNDMFESFVGSNYTVDKEGVVVRKGIRLQQFIREIRAVLARAN